MINTDFTASLTLERAAWMAEVVQMNGSSVLWSL